MSMLAKGDVLATPFDRWGGALGLGVLTGPVDSTFGVSGSYGTGKTARQAPGYIAEWFTPTDATVYDVFLADPVTGATTRIRAKCSLTLIMKSDAQFPDWSCDAPPAGGEFVPSTVSALYGNR